MTQASPSLSSTAASAARVFGAGLLQVHVVAPAGPLRDLLTATLSLYDVEWDLTPMRRVDLHVEVVPRPGGEPAAGTYLECAQMLVDATHDGLLATTRRGARLEGKLGEAEVWQMGVPASLVDGGWWPEIEDLVSLVVTTGWRRAGWTPVHGAGLAKGDVGVIVCAGSRGGKTTFSLAMARRGWRMVGDDKLLLGKVRGRPILGAVKHMLNVDPAASSWFPELGDITQRPIYSEWSPKRRVPLASVFPDAPERSLAPTHVIMLVRGGVGGDVSVAPMERADVMSALLHQTVIPTERHVARAVTTAVAGLAQSLEGLRVEVPDGAYADPLAVVPVEQALR